MRHGSAVTRGKNALSPALSHKWEGSLNLILSERAGLRPRSARASRRSREVPDTSWVQMILR